MQYKKTYPTRPLGACTAGNENKAAILINMAALFLQAPIEKKSSSEICTLFSQKRPILKKIKLGAKRIFQVVGAPITLLTHLIAKFAAAQGLGSPEETKRVNESKRETLKSMGGEEIKFGIKGWKSDHKFGIEVNYKDVKIRDPLFLDILVDDRIIVEVKATEKENPIHKVQLLTYLRLTGLRLGLVINFGARQIKEGIKRMING